MRSYCIVSPKTYREQEGKFAYYYTTDENPEELIPLPLLIDAGAADGMGYIWFEGEYMGAYGIAEIKGEREPKAQQ